MAYVHTAVPPLANGTSQPSVYNVADSLRVLGYDALVDEGPLRMVSQHLDHVAETEGQPKGAPVEFDVRVYHHQIPGGMQSNLEHQLRLAGGGDRLEETLVETGRVCAELGYPIMVTPLSQFVATQAALNVIVGERYKQVPDSVIEYALGRHGDQEAIDAMDPDVRAKILDRPRARQLQHLQRPDPSLAELRRKLGNVSDEELILRTVVGDDAMEVIRPTPPGPAPRGMKLPN